ncbi:MAG: Hpt domain-containing protein, partial [Gemmatimonadales bacterium]
MTAPPSDPLAEVCIEFAAGLEGRLQTLRDALQRLEGAFVAEDAERLHRAAHSLTGTAGSFGASRLAQVARELEQLGAGWVQRREAPPDEWRRATAVVT